MIKFLYNLATDKSGGFFAGILKFLLFALSLVYGLCVRILAWGYSLNLKRFDCKVISVGNITLGGTGKTVVVEFLARYLKNHGHRLAIVTRGYKRRVSSQEMGDEPFMLQSKLEDIAVIVDADRAGGIKVALQSRQVDTVILDDGFQQWKIKKDLDIVAVDACLAFGNGQILPRGILREPILALRRADVFILTKTNLNPDAQTIEAFLAHINQNALLVQAAHQPVSLYRLGGNEETLPLEWLKNRTVALFCGIGDPDSFQSLIISLGARVSLFLRFPDHHNYSQNDLDSISRQAEGRNVDTIITTEKDAARICQCRASASPKGASVPVSRLPVLVLRIELKITKNEEGLYSRLLKLYSF